jgi:hypothetical protein
MGYWPEFGSVVDAIECAVALQREMPERHKDIPLDQRINVRIGINLAGVIVEGEDCHGESCEVAADTATPLLPLGEHVLRDIPVSLRPLSAARHASGSSSRATASGPKRTSRGNGWRIP